MRVLALKVKTALSKVEIAVKEMDEWAIANEDHNLFQSS
jgi:hypothetical protein